MTGDARSTMPPVRLPSEAELAREALAAPLLSRAARLARWAESGVPVGAGGELLAGQLKEAADHLGLAEAGAARDIAGEEEREAADLAAEAWNFAVDTGLVEFEENDPAEGGEGASGGTGGLAADEPVGTATSGEALPRLLSGSPADVLEIWQEGMECVLAEAVTPTFEELLGDLQAVVEGSAADPSSIDMDQLDWDPEEAAGFLDSALGNLYLLTVSDATVASGALLPLPALAASMTVPEDMEEPTDEVLEEVSTAMMRLDGQFRVLTPIGLLEYRPVDEELTREAEESEELPELDDEDVSRYGMVRLTPLGLHGVRARMREAGLDAPAVGDLATADARELLDTLPGYPEASAQAEIECWLAARPADASDDGHGRAARELLTAARGNDADAPSRRLACQQALTLIGPSAEPALREVLADRQLGGLARVWLAERGAADVPQPDEEMVFWLTVDTIAAQLTAVGEAAELQELVQGLVDQHTGFFDKAWRVDHPATGDVLEAMGRVHPDRRTAKEARKAAFKARSRA
ncbi:hypothetical protein E0L36_06010 [Streptomyces sp. AJS327]|uniref:hypothetical protein n=1 Tax=Streptomyces sp. AJS327 TaxID=2545265 RepID=UPI0015DE285A|nr:hypothetical protein [Streptomyces sp. AJS327]MBA0050466.1 hypothetical protein [Streptomyces sp. AJS327]